VRRFVVEDLGKAVEAGLLLQEIPSGWFGGFFFQSQMHAFMGTVLLRVARFDALDADPQA
jgi:hypothetical protein